MNAFKVTSVKKTATIIYITFENFRLVAKAYKTGFGEYRAYLVSDYGTDAYSKVSLQDALQKLGEKVASELQ